jgi:hypothetical protein
MSQLAECTNYDLLFVKRSYLVSAWKILLNFDPPRHPEFGDLFGLVH